VKTKSLRVAGIMSGTSLDGIDVAIVDIRWPDLKLIAFHTERYPQSLRKRILAVSNTTCHTAEIARLHFEIPEHYTRAVKTCAAANSIPLESVQLIGCHGQTVYHEGPRCSLQLGEGAVLAERLGIETITNFRARDIAAGGHGAPLVPYFDWHALTHPEVNRVAINIGGIANVHALPAKAKAEEVFAFDTGPGNMIIDDLATIRTKGRQTYDHNAAFGLKGNLHRPTLDRLLKNRYFKQPPPKSAGREQYGADYVRNLIDSCGGIDNAITTATAFTATTIALGIQRFIETKFEVHECLVSGGGVHNPLLMGYLQGMLPSAYVHSIDDIGIPADAKEAMAFALLAAATKLGHSSNLPSATGASHPVPLGQFHPVG
jgi:anhydro-N-acetylmuramic acid kinase